MQSAEEKRRVLGEMSGAIDQLAQKLKSQQEAAVGIGDLATRLKGFGGRARKLAFANQAQAGAPLAALGDELVAFSTETAELVDRAARDAALGSDIADILWRHVADLDSLAIDIDTLPNAAAVRARLRPLAETLIAVPERLKAHRENSEEFKRLAARVVGFADRSLELARPPKRDHRDPLVKLSRDLADFSLNVVQIAARLLTEAAAAMGAIEAILDCSRTISLGRNPVDRVEASIRDLISAGHAAAAR